MRASQPATVRASFSPDISHSDGNSNTAPREGTWPTGGWLPSCRPGAITRRLGSHDWNAERRLAAMTRRTLLRLGGIVALLGLVGIAGCRMLGPWYEGRPLGYWLAHLKPALWKVSPGTEIRHLLVHSAHFRGHCRLLQLAPQIHDAAVRPPSTPHPPELAASADEL